MRSAPPPFSSPLFSPGHVAGALRKQSELGSYRQATVLQRIPLAHLRELCFPVCPMLDPKSLADRREEITESCRQRGVTVDVDATIAARERVTALQTELQ